MSITLTYRGETSLPVEIEGFVSDWACDKSLAEIERFEVFHGNRKVALAELFSISGDAADKRIDFEGDLGGVHRIGAQMRSGEIHVHGSAGRHLGSELRGGAIVVDDDAADWVGCEMRGGRIQIRGSAGNFVGAAYRGSPQGMRGGTIIVEGDVGTEAGWSMADGVVAVGGAAGAMVGFNMVGGTVLVLGDAGARPGAGMAGGKIALFGADPPAVLPSFRLDRTEKPEQLAPIVKELGEPMAMRFALELAKEMTVYVGDQLAEGTGEIYLRGAVVG